MATSTTKAEVPVTSSDTVIVTTAMEDPSATTATSLGAVPKVPTTTTVDIVSPPSGADIAAYLHLISDLRRDLQSLRTKQLHAEARNKALEEALAIAEAAAQSPSAQLLLNPPAPFSSPSGAFNPYVATVYSVPGGIPAVTLPSYPPGPPNPPPPGPPNPPGGPPFNPQVPPPGPKVIAKFKAQDLNLTFSGEGEIDEVSTNAKAFYNRIEDHIQLYQWDNLHAARIAQCNLKGKALGWITTERDSGEYFVNDWSLLKYAFLDRWYSTLSMAEKTERLKKLQQKNDELAKDYYDRTKQTVELLYGQDPKLPRITDPIILANDRAMKDKIIMTHFVGGLRPALRETVANGDHTTLKAIREAAIRGETASSNRHGAPVTKEILANENLGNAEVDANGKQPFRPKFGGRGNKKFDGNCAYCGVYGHRNRDCHKMKKDKSNGIWEPKDKEFFQRMKARFQKHTNSNDLENKNDENVETIDANEFYNFYNPQHPLN